MAKLYFKYGAMGSSKSAQALITQFNYEELGMTVWLIKPSVDDRDGANIVKSRVGLSREAEVITPEDSIRARYEATGGRDVIIADEAQFLTPEQIDELRDKANRLPLLPGVYIMKDVRGEVIYVGKAKALKNRVSSYFRGEHLPKVAAMADKVDDFDVIVVTSEFEALVLENSLIKRHKPYYNILLKDDKGYPYIRLDARSEYPTFSLTNRYAKDGARYFGPFGGRAQSRDIIDTVCKALLLPTCTRKFPRDIGKQRPCLNYHMGACAGWCMAGHTAEEYHAAMEQAAMILSGKTKQLTEELTEKMLAASEELKFELAASYRDRIRAIEGLGNRCLLYTSPSPRD